MINCLKKIMLAIFIFLSCILFSEIQKDIIYLLDTSGSMVGRPGSGGKNIFPKVKRTLMNMIDDIQMEVNTNIQVITFDMGVQSSKSFIISSDQDKQKIKNYIYNLTAEGDKTWITHGLQGAFEEFEVMKALNPEYEHWQYLYMFTDAINTGPGSPPISFDEITDRFNLRSAEFNRDLYIVTLGVPSNVVDDLKNKLGNTDVHIIPQEPGKTHIPINLTLKTDKKKYQENEPINIVAVSKAIDLKLKKVTATITNPVGEKYNCILKKKLDLFEGTFINTDISGEYVVDISEKKVQSYILNSKNPLQIKVIPPKFKIYWKNMKRLKSNSSNLVTFYIKGKKLTKARNVNITFKVEDGDKLMLMKNGNEFKNLSLEIKPETENQFEVSFYSVRKIDWINGTKFMGTIDGEYNFQGKVYGKIPIWFWILLLVSVIVSLIAIGLFVITPIRFQRKYISYGNNRTLLKLLNFRKNLLRSSVSIGKPGSTNIQIADCTEIGFLGISFFGYGYWFFESNNKIIKRWSEITTQQLVLNGIFIKITKK